MTQSRYTEYLKEKVMCCICKREISRGHIKNHLTSKIHLKHKETLEAAEKEKKKFFDQVVITWD